MGYYKYISQLWKRPLNKPLVELYRKRLVEWRRQQSIVRVEKPTRVNRAHALGYKAKQGFVVVRVRVRKGGLNRPRPRSGRRPKRMGAVKYTPHKSSQFIAEERAAKKYPNLILLGSYWVGEDGKYEWYEVIMVDPENPCIKNDAERNWVSGVSKKVKYKSDKVKRILDKI